jgi:hypothetical protein
METSVQTAQRRLKHLATHLAHTVGEKYTNVVITVTIIPHRVK